MRSAPHGVALGIDVGGTKVLGLAVTTSGEVLSRVLTPTPKGTASELADAVGAVVVQLEGVVGAGAPIGVGLPGMMSTDGVLAFAPHLPEATGMDLAALLSERLGPRPVVVGNDADCALVAEHHLGAARDHREVVMVTLGTGIGGALLVGGRLHRGGGGFAGEVGHMVLDVDGPPCPCGASGCWERYASGSGLGRLAREAADAGLLRSVTAAVGGNPEAVRGEDVTAAASAGDPEALAVVYEVAWWLARGIANLVCVLDPTCIVVGGGMSDVAALLVPPAARQLAGLLEGSSARTTPELVSAALGAEAGAIGAALRAGESS